MMCLAVLVELRPSDRRADRRR